MWFIHEELAKLYRQRLWQEARASRLHRETRPRRQPGYLRALAGVGDGLISLGLKVRSLAEPAGERDYSQLFT